MLLRLFMITSIAAITSSCSIHFPPPDGNAGPYLTEYDYGINVNHAYFHEDDVSPSNRGQLTY